jgi:glycosyltransferase involved in cell wall biosynthesis
MTEPTERISVVLTTYNGERHLMEQLQSLVDQRRRPDELVISDDGSTDGTLALAEAFAVEAPFPVRVHRQPVNLGPDQNFSAALALATGDLVFCCDQDDRWHPDKLERMASRFASQPGLGLVLCDGRLVDEAMTPTGGTIWQWFGFDAAAQDEVEHGEAFAVLARRMPVYGCTMAVRRDLSGSCLPVPEGCTFDSWIGQIVSVLAPVALIREPLIDYRQHATQVTGFQEGSRFRRLLGMLGRSDARAVDAELVRLRAMRDRLATLPATPKREDAQRITADRLRLTERRLAARRSVVRRVPLIAVGVLRGEYRRGAQGLRSAAIDLLARPGR